MAPNERITESAALLCMLKQHLESGTYTIDTIRTSKYVLVTRLQRVLFSFFHFSLQTKFFSFRQIPFRLSQTPLCSTLFIRQLKVFASENTSRITSNNVMTSNKRDTAQIKVISCLSLTFLQLPSFFRKTLKKT